MRTGAVPREGGPPAGLHRLEFTAPRPFEVQELRRLSPAADYHRSLIGAGLSVGGGLEIWGIVQSGPGWVRTFQGGRDRHAPLPPALVVHVSGPGRLGAYRGDSLVAKLERGEISGSSMDVFASTRALADYLEESEGPEEARRFALLAARGATEALEERHDLAISVLVGQVRSMAVDLLRSTGMHQAQALAALEEVAPRGSGDP